MAWEIILPIVANIIQGGLAGGMQANAATRENNRQRDMANLRRQELQPLIEQLRRGRDYFGVEENLVRDFSRAADQMSAQSAQTGMTNAGSGGLDRNRSDLLGGLLAQLATVKQQNESQDTQLLAQILGDPTLYGGIGNPDNVGASTAMGGLLGGASGLGSILTAFLATEEGLAALGSLFGGGAEEPGISDASYTDPFFDFLTTPPATRAPAAPRFGVSYDTGLG